jgi:tRNA(fMet)-specific endonuclease VapC
MYLLDTNVCIRLMNGNTNIRQRIANLKGITINISVIVAGELLFGAYKSSRIAENLDTVYTLLDSMNEIYYIDTDTLILIL